MDRRGRALLLVSALVLATLLDADANRCRGAQEGHGGGAGHGFAAAYRGGYRGYYGWCGRPYGWCYPGFAVGVGLGCGLAYPYYGYYYDGYGPVYVDPGSYPPGLEGYFPPAYPANGAPPPYGAVPAGPANSTATGPAPPVRLTDTNVLFSVRVPADAVVWFNGFRTTQIGPRREFASSGLVPGRSYTFDIRAQWTGSDGQAVDLTRRISVQGGERRTVDFTAAPPAGHAGP